MQTELAGLALARGRWRQAAGLACEALDNLPETPNARRCKAPSELGAALIGKWQFAIALSFLYQAIEMVALVGESWVGTSALCQVGLCSLNHRDFVDAERRFRAAIGS